MDTKSLTKRLAIALLVAGGLTLGTLAKAQDIYYMFNFDPPWGNSNAQLYGNWNDWPANPSEVNFTTLFYPNDYAAGGLEVTSTAGGYGSGYANLNGGTGVEFYPNFNSALTTNDTLCILSFTVNPTPSMAASGPMFYTNYNWIGIQFFPNLDTGPTTFLPALYSGWNNPGNSNGMVWSGSNVTLTVNMAALTQPSDVAGFTTYGQAFTTYTQGGTNHFYGFNIGVAPSVIHNDPSNLPYDITFNSVTFAPPPATPPNLSVTLTGGDVVLTWPDPNTNTFTLYQSANMALFSWSPWAFPPVWNNGTNTVAIPPPFGHTLFFRLGNTNLL